MALRAFFGGLIEKRRAQPGDDLISALVRASESGVNLSDEQVIGFAILLLIAGNETTTNLLGSLLNRLAHRRNDWRRLKADPALIDAAIEEALRTDSPAQFVVRRAKADLAVGDQLIKAGDAVMIYLAAANRDPAKWDDPAAFEIAREKERHVAFGHGVHHCIGAPLARLEAQAVMKALVARFDGVRPGKGAPRRLPSGLLFGFRELPLVFC
jgi:cytochrome P450